VSHPARFTTRRALGLPDALSDMRIVQGQRAYRQFVKRIIVPIHFFWLTQDESALAAAGEALREAFDASDLDEFTQTGQRLELRGWLSVSSGYELNVHTLREQNPEFTVQVRRHPRRELLRGFRFHGIRPGFEVIARSDSATSPFSFFVTDTAGRPSRIPSSNHEAQFASSVGDTPSQALRTRETWPLADTNVGFLDSVTASSGVKLRKRTRELWFSSVVHDYPEEMLALVDSAAGGFAVAKAAECLSTFPVNARWRDRFELAAHGIDGTFTSDLKALHVERPYGLDEPSQRTDLLLPALVTGNGVARTIPGAHFIRSPSSEWLTFDGVDLQGGGTVIRGHELITFEAAADPTLDFVSGQWSTIFGSRLKGNGALVQLSEIEGPSVPEAILLSGRNDDNWYHWFIEYLPRVLMIPDDIPADVPLLVSSRTPESGLAVLRSLTRRPIVALDASVRTHVDKLHLVAPTTQILDTTMVSWAGGVTMNPAPLMELRRRLRRSVNTSPGAQRRIFLVRNSRHRGLRNSQRIARIASSNGLELVDPAQLTWEQQCELFSGAELVVGAGGAVMANYLIMPEGSRVIALTSELLEGFVLPALICAVAGVNFEYVVGSVKKMEGRVRKMSKRIHDDFKIDEKIFTAELLGAISGLDTARGLHRPVRIPG
jgi:capsular polysaccharide biosynthesis protein